ncbi:MAG: ADP-glucose pyrophosphorylase [Magnetovibrio sp.]|nr:ADP-glucose pyrophosphorylase [Magnetovibrio sp.]
MKALMLAAGVGRRLYGNENDDLPKALLSFGGKSLFQRNIEILKDCAVEQLFLVVGHRSEDLIAESNRIAPDGFVKTIFNPRYREGPILSLACGSPVLRSGSPMVFMDADVLYHPEILYRLVGSPHETCFVFDREFQSTDDFVKLCLLDGKVVDFGKALIREHDTICEWPGFMKMSPDIAAKIADYADHIVMSGEIEGAYERAISAVLYNEPMGTFGCEDITGIPWVEIDYESDLKKAVTQIIPRITRFG